MRDLLPIVWSCGLCSRTFNSRLLLEKHVQSRPHKSLPEIKRLLTDTALSIIDISKQVKCSKKAVERVAKDALGKTRTEEEQQELLEQNILEMSKSREVSSLVQLCFDRKLDILFISQDRQGTKLSKDTFYINGWLCRIPSKQRYVTVSLDFQSVEFLLVPLKRDWLVIPCSQMHDGPANPLKSRDWSRFLNAWEQLRKARMPLSIVEDMPDNDIEKEKPHHYLN